MEWLVWMIVGLAVVSACRGGCARGRRGHARLASGWGAVRRGGPPRSRALEASRSSGRGGVEELVGTVTRSPQSPLETLQRRFVEGRIDLEGYERELDRLYALDAGKR